jgi:hypothetical protein
LLVFLEFLDDHGFFSHHVGVTSVSAGPFIDNPKKWLLRLSRLFYGLNSFDFGQLEEGELLTAHLFRLVFVHALDVLKGQVHRQVGNRHVAPFIAELPSGRVFGLLIVVCRYQL